MKKEPNSSAIFKKSVRKSEGRGCTYVSIERARAAVLVGHHRRQANRLVVLQVRDMCIQT